MTTDDPPTVASDAGDVPATPSTFTREELDAAEPERPPSPRFRWVIGLGLGAFAALYTGFPLGIVALPFAFTGAGAGALLGTGLVFLASFAFDAFVWLNDDLVAVEPGTFLSWSLAGFAALLAGIAGTVVVARRSRRRSRA
ncbi:MAG TPA: hypothetical protein VER83_09125 [Candidatus Nanopelagicales bacterium]|nr:hypothetical protein [Candidatus Nanopelagicales bacterium]